MGRDTKCEDHVGDHPRDGQEVSHRQETCAVKTRRRAICHAVSSLPPGASSDAISELFDPLLLVDTCVEEVDTAGGGNEADDGVTPLMIACDKCHRGFLSYIEGRIKTTWDGDVDTTIKFITSVVGHPLDVSARACGANSAAHFAATSGFAEGIDCLSSLLTALKEISTQSSIRSNGKLSARLRNVAKRGNDFWSYYLELLMQRNNHGDTVIMMASASGHELAIRHWISCLSTSRSDSNDDSSVLPHSGAICWADVQNAFRLKNNAGDSALSLACGHGHHAVVTCLIDSSMVSVGGGDAALDEFSEETAAVTVTYEDVEKCRSLLARIDAALPTVQQGKSEHEKKQLVARRDNVRRCLVILQVCSARAAQRSMDHLLREEEEREKGDSLNKGIGNKSVPENIGVQKKRRDKPKKITSGEDVAVRVPDSARAYDKKDEPIPNSDISPIVTLEDGSVVCQSAGQENRLSTSVDHFPALDPPSDHRTLDDLLRDRYRQSTSDAANEIQGSSSTAVELIMDSLCLDASMLLQTPHGMAMQLSPCQLDAVNDILKHQMSAVEEARRIQLRLLAQTPTNEQTNDQIN